MIVSFGAHGVSAFAMFRVKSERDRARIGAVLTDAELAAAQAWLRPELVAAIGVGAIAVLVWLMEMKPF